MLPAPEQPTQEAEYSQQVDTHMDDTPTDEKTLNEPLGGAGGTPPTDNSTPVTSPQPALMPTSPSATTADFSTLFASPVPKLAQPVMTPFRLHENENPDSSQPPNPISPAHSQSVASIEETRLSSLSPQQLSILESLVPSTSVVTTIQADHKMKGITPSAINKPDADQENHQIASTTPVVQQDQSTNLTHPSRSLLSPSTPSRKQPQAASGSRIFGTNSTLQFHESLVPVTSPSPTRPLPFPITPQRTNNVTSYQSFTLASSNKTSNFSPSSTSVQSNQAHLNVQTHTTSRIPIPVATPVKRSHGLSSAGGTSNIGANTSITSPLTPPNVLSPNTSQLRQPSTLRNTLTGAASKIPRPGKKPYAKPASRLPKPKALTKLGPGTITTTTTTTTITPPQSVSEVSMSPIKTRRARLNAAAAVASKPRGTNTISNELPSDIIILQPRPPKEAPRPTTPEQMPDFDQEPIMIGGDSVVSVRASPPIETGLSPPRSGLLLRDETRRLKQEADAPVATIPEFTATAPSLGIFPSAARPKGRGKNTLITPMMMPLDPTSLRNLTTSNTLRNQQYVCSKVETQILMKEGKRPASPTSKVRTLLDKQKEGKDKSREERAARRRIASGDGDEEMEDSAASRKHPRAAGDDEDYQTPVKVRELEQMELDETNEKVKKRVKWNVDLTQRFELDPSDLEGIRKGAEMARAKSITKSCLATRILLDPLGNVPDADVPISDLKKIDVIVTKLVYADDLPPPEQPAPKPPPKQPTKQTGKRTATKKANSRIAVDTT